MRLIRGAPGSGKTALVFREFKEALRAGVPDLHSVDLRIIVPTATLVRHFRHELARDGIVFSPKLIVSLSRFANERAPGPDPLPDDLLAAIVRECLRRNKIPNSPASPIPKAWSPPSSRPSRSSKMTPALRTNWPPSKG